jgi:hypothetical protein
VTACDLWARVGNGAVFALSALGAGSWAIDPSGVRVAQIVAHLYPLGVDAVVLGGIAWTTISLMKFRAANPALAVGLAILGVVLGASLAGKNGLQRPSIDVAVVAILFVLGILLGRDGAHALAARWGILLGCLGSLARMALIWHSNGDVLLRRVGEPIVLGSHLEIGMAAIAIGAVLAAGSMFKPGPGWRFILWLLLTATLCASLVRIPFVGALLTAITGATAYLCLQSSPSRFRWTELSIAGLMFAAIVLAPLSGKSGAVALSGWGRGLREAAHAPWVGVGLDKLGEPVEQTVTSYGPDAQLVVVTEPSSSFILLIAAFGVVGLITTLLIIFGLIVGVRSAIAAKDSELAALLVSVTVGSLFLCLFGWGGSSAGSFLFALVGARSVSHAPSAAPCRVLNSNA